MQRQQLVIKKMTDLVEAADPSDQAKLCCTPSTFKMNLKDDFEFLTKKINDLSQAKKKAEDRWAIICCQWRLYDQGQIAHSHFWFNLDT